MFRKNVRGWLDSSWVTEPGHLSFISVLRLPTCVVPHRRECTHARTHTLHVCNTLSAHTTIIKRLKCDKLYIMRYFCIVLTILK